MQIRVIHGTRLRKVYFGTSRFTRITITTTKTTTDDLRDVCCVKIVVEVFLRSGVPRSPYPVVSETVCFVGLFSITVKSKGKTVFNYFGYKTAS